MSPESLAAMYLAETTMIQYYVAGGQNKYGGSVEVYFR